MDWFTGGISDAVSAVSSGAEQIASAGSSVFGSGAAVIGAGFQQAASGSGFQQVYSSVDSAFPSDYFEKTRLRSLTDLGVEPDVQYPESAQFWTLPTKSSARALVVSENGINQQLERLCSAHAELRQIAFRDSENGSFTANLKPFRVLLPRGKAATKANSVFVVLSIESGYISSSGLKVEPADWDLAFECRLADLRPTAGEYRVDRLFSLLCGAVSNIADTEHSSFGRGAGSKPMPWSDWIADPKNRQSEINLKTFIQRWMTQVSADGRFNRFGHKIEFTDPSGVGASGVDASLRLLHSQDGREDENFLAFFEPEAGSGRGGGDDGAASLDGALGAALSHRLLDSKFKAGSFGCMSAGKVDRLIQKLRDFQAGLAIDYDLNSSDFQRLLRVRQGTSLAIEKVRKEGPLQFEASRRFGQRAWVVPASDYVSAYRLAEHRTIGVRTGWAIRPRDGNPDEARVEMSNVVLLYRHFESTLLQGAAFQQAQSVGEAVAAFAVNQTDMSGGERDRHREDALCKMAVGGHASFRVAGLTGAGPLRFDNFSAGNTADADFSAALSNFYPLKDFVLPETRALVEYVKSDFEKAYGALQGCLESDRSGGSVPPGFGRGPWFDASQAEVVEGSEDGAIGAGVVSSLNLSPNVVVIMPAIPPVAAPPGLRPDPVAPVQPPPSGDNGTQPPKPAPGDGTSAHTHARAAGKLYWSLLSASSNISSPLAVSGRNDSASPVYMAYLQLRFTAGDDDDSTFKHAVVVADEADSEGTAIAFTSSSTQRASPSTTLSSVSRKDGTWCSAETRIQGETISIDAGQSVTFTLRGTLGTAVDEYKFVVDESLATQAGASAGLNTVNLTVAASSS